MRVFFYAVSIELKLSKTKISGKPALPGDLIKRKPA